MSAGIPDISGKSEISGISENDGVYQVFLELSITQKFVKDDYNKGNPFFALFFTQNEESIHHVFVIYDLFERTIQCSLCGCL